MDDIRTIVFKKPTEPGVEYSPTVIVNGSKQITPLSWDWWRDEASDTWLVQIKVKGEDLRWDGGYGRSGA